MITTYFIKRKIRALAAEAIHRSCRSLSIGEARSILVLYNVEDQTAIMEVLKPLRRGKKKIQTCVFIPAQQADVSFDKATCVPIYQADLSAWGFPSAQAMDQIKAMKADILIDLSRPACYPLQYVALWHPSLFKVGIQYPDQEWYDMGVTPADRSDVRYLFEQILFYLRSITAVPTT